MRYRHFSVLRGRKVFGLVIALFVIPIILNSLVSLPWRKQAHIREGIIFADSNLGGLTFGEAEIVITQIAPTLSIAPINAQTDPVTTGIIPDVNGVTVDVLQTLEAAKNAKSGTVIKPIYQAVKANITLSAFPESPIYKGNSAKKQVAFLINVAWGNEYLEEMVTVLKEKNAQATFFLVGRWVRGNPTEAKRLANEGFEIANHGDSDALSMIKADLLTAAGDIRKAADVIEATCGVRPLFFSPHRGEITPTVLKAAASENSRVIMWTLDTVDWQLPGVDVMLDKITSRAVGGSLILMHPTAQTAEFLRQVIPVLRQKGLEPVTLTELLSPTRAPKE